MRIATEFRNFRFPARCLFIYLSVGHLTTLLHYMASNARRIL